MFETLVVPFMLTLASEIGDKTQLSLILLSSKVRSTYLLLIGSVAGFLVTDGVAVFIGAGVARALPGWMLRLAASIIFIAIGVHTILTKSGFQADIRAGNPFAVGFIVTFLSEWGDKSQVASATLASIYDPVLVFTGVMAALFLISLTTIWVGRGMASRMRRRGYSHVAGVLFVTFGLVLLIL